MPNGQHVKECYYYGHSDSSSFQCLNRIDKTNLFQTKLHEKKGSISVKPSVNLNTELDFDENGFSLIVVGENRKVSWDESFDVLRNNNKCQLSSKSQIISCGDLFLLIAGDYGFSGRDYFHNSKSQK